MRIGGIQNNNNPQFQGVIKVQYFKKADEILQKKTSIDLDRGLSQCALKDVFEGDWANTGNKRIDSHKLTQYIAALRGTLDINLPRLTTKTKAVELKQFGDGYSIKIGNDYKITHFREDHMVWD